MPGASIVFQHQEFLDLRYNVKTGADGTVMVNDIPEGRYVYNISATGHVPYSGTFVVQPGLTTTVPVALEVTLIDIEWSVTEVVIQDRYEITIKQTFQTEVPAPVIVVEPPNVNLPPMEPGQVFQGEFTVTNYGLIEVNDVTINFPRTVGDYDIEVMTDAVPDKIGAMQSITVPYRITRRAQTASAATTLFDEVRGYGGTPCPMSFRISIGCNYIVCPNTTFARVAEKVVNFYLSLFDYTRDCTGGTGGSFGGGTGGGSWYGGGGGFIGQGGGAIIGGSNPVAIKTDNPCNCKNEGMVLPDGRVCVDGKPVEPEYCDISADYNETQNRYDDIIKCAAVANGINPHTIKDVIKAESAFARDAFVGGDKSTGLMQIIPGTARSLGLTGTDPEIIEKLKKPCINIDIGTKYLSQGMNAIKQSLDNAGIIYDEEDLRVYLEVYFNIGAGGFQYAIEIAVNNEITIDSWEDFTTPQEKLGGVSIMRKTIEAKFSKIAKDCSGYKANNKPKKSADLKQKKNKSKLPYDKNKNSVLDEQEWYDWRTNEILEKRRMRKVANIFNNRELNTCPIGSFNCDETKKNEQCNK